VQPMVSVKKASSTMGCDDPCDGKREDEPILASSGQSRKRGRQKISRASKKPE
jgi:hypothetical protein